MSSQLWNPVLSRPTQNCIEEHKFGWKYFYTFITLMYSERNKLKIIYDGGCPLCIRTVRILKLLDWLANLGYEDLMNWEKLSAGYPTLTLEKCLQEMHVISPRGEIASGFFGFRKICAHLVLGWLILPFLYLPGVPTLGHYFYLKIAKNRKRPGVRCTRHAWLWTTKIKKRRLTEWARETFLRALKSKLMRK